MSYNMVAYLPLAWHRNIGVGRLSRRGLAGRRRGLAGPAAGYPDFASYNSAVCLPMSGAVMCPPPYDPACVGPASANVSACQAAWVTDPTSCHNIVCDSSGSPQISYQSYTTPSGQASAAVGYQTTTGFVPVAPAPPPPAPPPAAAPAPPSAVQPARVPPPVAITGGPAGVIQPAPSLQPVVYSPALSFRTSRGGSTALQPGDTWTISIAGAPPLTPVTVTGNTAGNLTNSVTTPMGTTDAAGNFSLSGSITADQAGAWSESWQVGGRTVGSFSFTVTVPVPAAAPAAPAGPAAVPTGPGSPPVSPYYLGPSPPPAAGAGTPQDMTGTTAAGAAAAQVPTWVWIAGAALVGVMLFKGK